MIIDQPYGLQQEGWDNQWTTDEFKVILKQIDAVSVGDKFFIAIYCGHRISSQTVFWLEEYGYQHVSQIHWYKANQNLEGPQQLIFAFELIIIAWRSGFTGMPFHMERNPMRRHNIIVGPALRVHHKHSNGENINPYQKPAYIAYQLCKVFAQPLDNILIVGFGAGGDVEGASAAGMNVVAIEREKTQFDATLAVWRTHQQQLLGGPATRPCSPPS